MAVYTLEPWGEERADLRAGIIASASLAPHCRRGHTPRPADFMPRFGPDVARPAAPAKSLAEAKATFALAKAAFARVSTRRTQPHG